MRRILAIDPANRCGWAYSGTDGKRLYGVWSIIKPGDAQPGDRLRRFHEGLTELVAHFPVEVVAYEDAHYGAKNHDTAAMHAELRGITKMVAAAVGASCVAYKPSTIKKFATGNGHAKKPQMVEACRRLLRIEPEDDNVADALWILEMARRNFEPPAKAKRRRRALRAKDPKLF